jgi:hypothetical protein
MHDDSTQGRMDDAAGGRSPRVGTVEREGKER